MRRIAGVVAGVAVLLGIGAAPAMADYHGACPGGIGSGAFVNLTVASGTLTYSGTVNCNGATSIQINSLTLTDPGGASVNAGPKSCSPCNQLTHSGTAPVGAAGNYVVTMSFTVVGGGRTFSPGRTRTWSWNGTNLTPISGGTTPSAFDFCDGTQPLAADSEFDNDNSNPADPLRMAVHGHLECHGVDGLAITLLSVRRQGVSGNTLIGPPRNAPQVSCSGCAQLDTGATFPSDGPGRYRLTFRVAVTKGTETRTHTSTTDYVSLGVGPVQVIE